MEFKKDTTKRAYLNALRKFKAKLGIQDLVDYLKSMPDVSNDVRKFLSTLDGKPRKTVSTYVGAVKVFLQDHGVKAPVEEWTKIKRARIGSSEKELVSLFFSEARFT